MSNNEVIRKEDIFHYTYIDENGDTVTVLNEQFLKNLFNCNELVFEEKEHK